MLLLALSTACLIFWLIFLSECSSSSVQQSTGGWPAARDLARSFDSFRHDLKTFLFQSATPPFPQIDIIRAVVIVWRVRGKTIRSVLCNIVCNNCAQCDAHTYEQTNSSLDWVLSHWAHFTVPDSFLYCVLLCVVCMIA